MATPPKIRTLFKALMSVASFSLVSQQALAQSLSLGGVNVRPGMKIDSLLRALPQQLSANVVQDNAFTIESGEEILGHLTHENGRIVEITKYMINPIASSAERYLSAFQEFKRKTNTMLCAVEVTATDRSESQTRMKCGRYTLVSKVASITGVEHFFYITLK
jgi:hypothetical protein